MAKRFTSTKIWSEDWFLDMPNEYKLFWFYLLSECDHAGIFKVNLRSFCSQLEVKIDLDRALLFYNVDKHRIRVIKPGLWLIEDFFIFQYGNKLNIKNRVHNSILGQYQAHNICLNSIRGLNEVKLTPISGLVEDKHGVKDKDIYNTIIVDILDGDKEINDSEKIKLKMLIIEMYKVWQGHNPIYPKDEQKDYHALLQFAYKIAENKKWSKSEIISKREKDCIASWDKICEYIMADSFLRDKALSTCLNQWQSIFMGMSKKKGIDHLQAKAITPEEYFNTNN